MDKQTKKTLEVAEEAVDRQRRDAKSKQPRFADDVRAFFYSVLGWVRRAEDEEPEYAANSRKRDTWLSGFWPQETHLAGVLNSVVAIDKNRGWTLTGGRNQVRRYTKILHNYGAAPGLFGWRGGISSSALSFYTADINAIVEIGRDGRDGPLRELWHVDPTQCKLTGQPRTPLYYNPRQGPEQHWTEADFFRVASLPNVQEQFNGLGFCAVSRCVQLAQIMIAVYQYDQEQLGAAAPKGLLLLQGLTEGQWIDAMNARREDRTAAERQYYEGVYILATGNLGDIDAKLISLSNLPANFDLKEFTDLLMYGYALAFGYDPSEFWPVQFGSLGRGTESQTQHMKATGKGGLDFALGFQEQIALDLPESLSFQFDQRDDESELLQAEVSRAWIDAVVRGYEAGLAEGAPLFQREQALSLLAEHSIIPPEWSEIEEETIATDTEAAETEDDAAPPANNNLQALRERALEDPQVREAIRLFPGEPIVRYHYPTGRETLLWRRGLDAVAARGAWLVERQGDVLAENEDVVITTEDVDRAMAEGDRRFPDIAGIWEAVEEVIE